MLETLVDLKKVVGSVHHVAQVFSMSCGSFDFTVTLGDFSRWLVFLFLSMNFSSSLGIYLFILY